MENPKIIIVPQLEALLPNAFAVKFDESDLPNGAEKKPEEQVWDGSEIADENLTAFVRSNGIGQLVASAGPWKAGAILDGYRRFHIAKKLKVAVGGNVRCIPIADIGEAKRIRWQLNISTKRTVPYYLVVRSFLTDGDFKKYFDSLAAEGRRRMSEGGRKKGKSDGTNLGGFNRRLEAAKFCMVPPWQFYYASAVFNWEQNFSEFFDDAAKLEFKKTIRKALIGQRDAKSAYMHLKNHLRRGNRGERLAIAANLKSDPSNNPSYKEGDANTVYHGDAVATMKTMPNELVDRVVTSPPYHAKKVKYGSDWKGFPTWEAYAEFTKAYLGECWRVLAPHGVLIVQVDDTTEDHEDARKEGREMRKPFDVSSLIKIHVASLGCEYWQTKIWTKKQMSAKASAFGSIYHPNNRPNHEYILIFYKGYRDKEGMRPLMDERELGDLSLSTWDLAAQCDRDKTETHPTPYPLELADRMVRYGGSQGDLVLDPFCGIGRTLEAAAKCGCTFMGIEQHSVYARRSLEAGKKGLKDFQSETKKPYVPEF